MVNVMNGRPDHLAAEPSTAELVQRATEQISRLVRDEFALARVELAEKGRHAGVGLGLFGGGGVFAFYALGAIVAGAVLLLAEVLPGWAAALIIGGVLLAIAGISALLGWAQVRQAVPPTPETLTSSVRADVRTVSAAVRRERGIRP